MVGKSCRAAAARDAFCRESTPAPARRMKGNDALVFNFNEDEMGFLPGLIRSERVKALLRECLSGLLISRFPQRRSGAEPETCLKLAIVCRNRFVLCSRIDRPSSRFFLKLSSFCNSGNLDGRRRIDRSCSPSFAPREKAPPFRRNACKFSQARTFFCKWRSSESAL